MLSTFLTVLVLSDTKVIGPVWVVETVQSDPSLLYIISLP